MLFTSSASFVSPCPLLHSVFRYTPFYAVDFLFCGWDFYSFHLFWFFSHQHVCKHVAHDLLGYLEMASGRVARERVRWHMTGICQLSLRGRKFQHFADPFLWFAIASIFPSSVTLRLMYFLWGKAHLCMFVVLTSPSSWSFQTSHLFGTKGLRSMTYIRWMKDSGSVEALKKMATYLRGQKNAGFWVISDNE